MLLEYFTPLILKDQLFTCNTPDSGEAPCFSYKCCVPPITRQPNTHGFSLTSKQILQSSLLDANTPKLDFYFFLLLAMSNVHEDRRKKLQLICS